jgi:hypothetical protein
MADIMPDPKGACTVHRAQSDGAMLDSIPSEKEAIYTSLLKRDPVPDYDSVTYGTEMQRC